MRRLLRSRFTLLWGQKGISLIETLVAVGILAVIGGGIAWALFSGFRGGETVAEYATAERLARIQIEDIRDAPYDDTAPLDYPEIDVPARYSILVDPVKLEGDGDGGVIQTITVTVLYDGDTVITLDTFKVKYTL